MISIQAQLDKVKADIDAISGQLEDAYDLIYTRDTTDAPEHDSPTPQPDPAPDDPAASAPVRADPPPVPLRANSHPGPRDLPQPVWKPALHHVPHILATCWGNREDEQRGEWSQMAYSWSPRCSAGSGKVTRGCALPGRVPRGTTVTITYRGRSVSAPVIDVGPWETADPYWRTGARPAAENGTDSRGRRTNRAGIDLTPAVWSELLGVPVEKVWAASPSDYVDIAVEEPAQQPGAGHPAMQPAQQSASPLSVGERIAAAARALPIPFPYAPGTEDGNLGCADVVSTALIHAGVLSAAEHQLSVKGLVDLLERKGWQAVSPASNPGDVIIWDATTASGGHEHVGVATIEHGQVYAVNNSSAQRRPVMVPLSSYNRPIDRVLRFPATPRPQPPGEATAQVPQASSPQQPAPHLNIPLETVATAALELVAPEAAPLIGLIETVSNILK